MYDDLETATFASEVRGPQPPNIARAALLFARELHDPSLRISHYLRRLDDWADAARWRMPATGSPLARAAGLAAFLFEDIGLRGNQDDYYDPRNSYLNEVIERRLGLPITLSVLFLAVAERVGLEAEGIGLPGHFIVAVRDGGMRYFLDPFHGGAWLTREDLDDLVGEAGGVRGRLLRDWLAPMPPEAILARMLFNLRGVHVQNEDWRQALAVVERLRILQPASPEHVRDAGLLHYRNGSLRLAAGALQEYVTRAPSAPDTGTVRDTLHALLSQLARLN